MKWMAALSQSPETVGTISGLGMFLMWPQRSDMLEMPGYALIAMAVLASLAGFIVATYSGRAKEPIERAVRRGAWAGFFAVVVGAVCFILLARTMPETTSALKAVGIPVTCAMPAMLTGIIAAGFGGFFSQAFPEAAGSGLEVGCSELPPEFQWTVRTLIGFGMGVALLALFSRTGISWDQAFSTGAPDSRFQYSTPEALKSAPAVAWTVVAKREMGDISPDRAFALSKDERFLAGVHAFNGSPLTVYDLESSAVTTIPGLPFSPDRVAFSPSGDRLFVVGGPHPRRIAVVDIARRLITTLPQPKMHDVPDGRVAWWTDNRIVSVSETNAEWALNLDSLELEPAKLSLAATRQFFKEVLPGLPKNEQWELGNGLMLTSVELPATEGTKEWPKDRTGLLTVSDLQRAYVRFFPEIDLNESRRLIGVTDHSKLLRFQEGKLTVFYFGTRPVPPLRWRITLPHGPELMPQGERTARALARDELALMLYGPMINPLNNRTVGPDRTKPKAVLHFARWEGVEAEIWIVHDYFSYTPGDVLADVHVEKPKHELMSFDQPRPWWIVAPAPLPDASDPAMLPMKTDSQKRRAAAIAAEERAAKDAEEARVAAQAKNAPQIVPSTPPEQVPAAVASPLWANMPSLPRKLVGAVEKSLKGNADMSAIAKDVAVFVHEHHRKASDGELTRLLEDYAERVDHFENGIVDRPFIFADEQKYHQKFRYVHEKIPGPVNVRQLAQGRVEASYTMVNDWLRASDGKPGSGSFDVTLELLRQPGSGWKIVKHRSQITP